jgi:LmbE family N-acetylglucosaminyl deacetylase
MGTTIPTSATGVDAALEELVKLGDVLAVWAHPDDETYLAGGLFAALRDLGHRVVCVTATRGEAADPAAASDERAALAAVRTEELQAALGTLGVAEHHWLDYPDGGCADLDPDGPVERLAALLAEVRPRTVVTFGPDGFTGHPDHRTVSTWTDLALARVGLTPRVLHPVALDKPPDPELDDDLGVFELGRPRVCGDEELALRLRLAGAALERKVEALLRQASQTQGLVTAVGRERFSAWVATESFALPLATT